MPTYLNSNSTMVCIGQIRIEPGQYGQSKEWIANLPAGVTATSNLPVFNPVLYSTPVGSSQTIKLPATITNYYNVSIFAKTGELQVKFNDSSSPTLYIAEGTVYTVACTERTVDNIIFTVTGLAYLTVDTI